MLNGNINIFGYPEKMIDNHPSINFLGKDYPTLLEMVKNSLLNRGICNDKNYNTRDYKYDFSFDLDQYSKNQDSLKKQLNKLINITGGKKPIIFISDGCFTNNLFIREIREILGKEYENFVEEVYISYENNSLNLHLNNYIYENSIIILGGSYTNIEQINSNFLNGEFINHIKNVLYNNVNSKIIGICWGFQLISHIIGLKEVDSEKIMTTYLGEAQFGQMPSKLVVNIENLPYIYRNAINSITQNGINGLIHGTLTRTGHIVDDLIGSYKLLPQSLFPIFADPITGSCRIGGSTNGQFFGVQDHFEINPATDTDLVIGEFENIIHKLVNVYGDKIKNVVENFEIQRNISNNLGKPLYAGILSSFVNSIIKKHYFFEKKEKTHKTKQSLINSEKLLQIINKENFGEINKLMTENEYIEKLDNKGILKTLPILDWSVSRGIEEVSEILGIDLSLLIDNHSNFQYKNSTENGNYVIRDLGAGNGKLINEINQVGNTEINKVVYGVCDFAYFNIYEGLILVNNSGKLSKRIPENILKIFIEELLDIYGNIGEGNEKEKIIKALDKIRLESKKFKVCTMFSKNKTYRFNDNEDNLTDDDIIFLKYNLEIIEELKEYIKNNFYELVVGDYSKIIFGNFNSLYIGDENIKHVDLQIAIRSTSHIDSSSLSTVGKNFIDIFAKTGAIFIENGIIRSDSGVLRINEIVELGKNNNLIRILFIYDTKTSYITGALINKAPFLPIDKITINEGYKLLTPEEIEECSFLQLERLFRELLIFTFKDLKYNHDKNRQIIYFLKFLSNEISLNKNCNIKELIINEINRLIDEINEEYNKQYIKMDLNIFNLYLSKIGDKKVIELVNKGIFINPVWFNKNFERNN